MTLEVFITEALREDLGDGDHSSLACIPFDARQKARLLVKDTGIFAGMRFAQALYSRTDLQIQWTPLLEDGAAVNVGDVAFEIEGITRDILKTERLVLNVLQRMSGIASFTHRMKGLMEGTQCQLLDTRKTTPLLRSLEKEAVRIGGGANHRFGLFDAIMLKDNHIDYAGGIEAAIEATIEYLKQSGKSLEVVVEARNMDEVRRIVLYASDIKRILLDNFTPKQLKEAVAFIGSRTETEASGGINATNLREYALTGVNYISMGALTHTVRNFDLSLKAFR
jgi:nicotinate-nucleotide pyrophosphorylase (carboxylating)